MDILYLLNNLLIGVLFLLDFPRISLNECLLRKIKETFIEFSCIRFKTRFKKKSTEPYHLTFYRSQLIIVPETIADKKLVFKTKMLTFAEDLPYILNSSVVTTVKEIIIHAKVYNSKGKLYIRQTI